MKQVKIKILTTQTVDGESETIKTKTTGTMEATAEAYIIRYSLTHQEGHTTQTTLRVDRSSPKAAMEHTGRMVIEEGVTHTSPYRMGPYEMELEVTGIQVICRLQPEGGSVKLQYALAFNGVPASENTVELFIQS